MLNLLRACSLALPLVSFGPAFAQTAPDWNGLAASQSDVNRQSGPRQVPARTLPVPTADVSPQEQALIAGAYVPYWNADPKHFINYVSTFQQKYLYASKTPSLAG